MHPTAAEPENPSGSPAPPAPTSTGDEEAARASLAFLYGISRELAETLDLPTLLRNVLRLSIQHVGAINGSIIVLDAQSQPVESALVVNGRVLEHTTHQLQITYEQGLAGWVAANRQSVLIGDTSRDERWLLRPDDAADQTGPKSALSAPIVARGQFVGVMTLVHPIPGSFTQEHLALIQTITGQAGIAILNARLYSESRRQARIMTAVAEGAQSITASLDSNEVLRRILHQISQALNVEAVSLALLLPGGEFEFCASTLAGEDSPAGLRFTPDQDAAGRTVRTGQGAVVRGIRQEAGENPAPYQRFRFPVRSAAYAPIQSGGQVIGVLQAVNLPEGLVDAEALQVLAGVGSLAGTAIRHAQLFERLQAAHKRYYDLFEDNIEPILISDWEGCIVEVNQRTAQIVGAASQELVGQSIRRMVRFDRPAGEDVFADLRMGGEVSFESALAARDGEIPVQVQARAIVVEGASRLQWIVQDISERKKLDSLREELVSMVYHDLRSPLANVISSLRLLESLAPQESEPALGALIGIAARSAERVRRLTDSLLDMHRLEAGQPIGSRRWASPSGLVAEAVDAAAVLLESKKIQIEMDVREDLPELWIDADMLYRVLINLLENAIKFSPYASTIYIKGCHTGKDVALSVQDSGPGIPPAEHKRIFDKFARLPEKNSPKGFGLGLAFCRLAVTGHGGRIWVESEPGQGARFCFTLPASNPPRLA